MNSDFEKSIDFILKNEGGYVNHKNDRGGETNRGITAATLNRAYREGIVKHCCVRNITRDEAAAIYKAYYWDKAKCGTLPYPLSCLHFDAAVNHGVGAAVKLLQRTLNRFCKAGLKVDGSYGPMTAAAVRAVCQAPDYPSVAAEICGLYCDARGELYENIIRRNPSQEVFRRGWFNRLNRCRAMYKEAL